MADLITLDDYKTKLGVDPTDNRDDEQISNLIPVASAVIVSFTERDFGSPLVTEERTFVYSDDDAGYLDIDDAASITSVTLTVPHGSDVALTTDEWFALPPRREDSPVYTYLTLPGFHGGASYSPVMGFTRNLDVYAAEGRLRGIPTTFKIVAEWGWPVVPEDVALAAAWTIRDWISREDGDDLTAESIEGFSRAWGGRGATARQAQALPPRVLDLLAKYARTQV